VDGWRHAEEVGQFLARRAAAKKPALVVVAGKRGTGRTSFVNYLIRKWADARSDAPDVDFDRQKLIVASGSMDDYADEEQLWEWVLGLWPQVLDAEYQPLAPVEKAFEELRTTKPQAMASALQNVLMKLSVGLRAQSFALAGILEDVKKREIIDLARRAFDYVDALLLATVEYTVGNFDAVLSDSDEILDRDVGRTVVLREVNGPEAREVVVNRWKRYSDERPPFDDGVLDAGFAGRAWPLARVLTLIEYVLVQKINYGADERWPAATRLGFSEEEMCQQISYWDSRIRAR
jgi:hypothetical protein